MINKFILATINIFNTLIILALISISCSNNELKKCNTNIIPLPKEMIIENGTFELNKSISIEYDDLFNIEGEFLERILSDQFKLETGQNGKVLSLKKMNNYIKEGYQLKVNRNDISIEASSREGIFYGIQTLIQLMELNKYENDIELPTCKINDSPSFKHRGMLLDCCRHFFDKKVIKKYIDLLAQYKMNKLHWHLTEDQGWRIEIDKYPKLTSIGSQRKDSSGVYEGYYTKENIKEIVDYAKNKHIEVIPEIEFPGHSQAAIAAYPQLSCTGKPIDVATEWGVFKDIYCAGNDSVFTFMEDVLSEVIELFPSSFIHIGGDEAPKTRWENCPKCQKRMLEENLKDEHELQSYFIKRIEKYLNSRGKTLIGWDEILEGGLAKNAVVQSWRGMNGGIEAAKHGNKVIMSPTSHAYFDYSIKSTDMKQVYHFDPIPTELDSIQKQLVLGGECNLWSEHIPNKKKLDEMVFPRMLAMSEVLWSYPKERNYDAFLARADNHAHLLRSYGVNVGLDAFPCQISTLKDTSDKAQISIHPGRKDLQFKYQWGMDSLMLPMDSSLNMPINRSGLLKIQATKDNNLYGETVQQEIQLHKGLFNKVSYSSNYSSYYQANGESSLTDGQLGSLDFRDGDWQGFWDTKIDLTIDLEREIPFDSLNVHFYQYINSWIFSPIEISFNVSNDSINWTNLGIVKNEENISKRGKLIDKISINNSSKKPYRYINLVATPLKVIPNWHEAAGNSTWLFIDEIIVR